MSVPEYELISSISSPYFGVNNHRRKRSIDSNQPINIEFKAFGELFRLFLWPNHGLLSPTFQLSKQDELNNGTIAKENEKNVRKELSDCFYQGYDKAHAESAVAISLCNGMVSFNNIHLMEMEMEMGSWANFPNNYLNNIFIFPNILLKH